MNERQIIETAQSMFLKNSGRKEVVDFLANNNIIGEQAETIATDAYMSIKGQRQAIIKTSDSKEASSGLGSIIFGGILMIGGIVASMNSDTLWYGAIFVGLITLVKGFASRY